VSELRRTLLDEGDAPPELSPELRFLASRQAALAALIVDHAELYRHLHERFRREGSSRRVRAVALDAAGNLGTVLQELRRREDLVVALAHAPRVHPIPLPAIDQLVFCFLLLSGEVSADDQMALLSPAELDGVLGAESVKDWLAGVGADSRRSALG
jgi:hypothetical protein